jgi:hypothetical protein
MLQNVHSEELPKKKFKQIGVFSILITDCQGCCFLTFWGLNFLETFSTDLKSAGSSVFFIYIFYT